MGDKIYFTLINNLNFKKNSFFTVITSFNSNTNNHK